jgi:hypothetical protein
VVVRVSQQGIFDRAELLAFAESLQTTDAAGLNSFVAAG